MPLKPTLRLAELDALLQQLRSQLADRWIEEVLFNPHGIRCPPTTTTPLGQSWSENCS